MLFKVKIANMLTENTRPKKFTRELKICIRYFTQLVKKASVIRHYVYDVYDYKLSCIH